MSALDPLLGQVASQGAKLELAAGLNFSGALSAQKNPTTGMIDVTSTGGGGVASKPIAPVNAVQTAAFPGTYSGGTWTATATGALAASVFDGRAVAIGESVEINSLGVAALGNGVYVRGADTASKPTFTRRADANTGAAIAGAFYSVLGGLTFVTSSRTITTPGTPTLDTTPIAFGAVREKPLMHVDGTKAPYFIQAFQTRALADAYVASGNCQNADAIERFAEFSAANGGWTSTDINRGSYVLVLPNGVVPLERRIFTLGLFCVEGVSRSAVIYGGAIPSGDAWFIGAIHYPTLTAVAGLPGIGSGGLPLQIGRLTFSGSSVTREFGSFTADGFAVGQQVEVHGTALNNYAGGTAKTIASLTANTLTFTTTVVSEVASQGGMTALQGAVRYSDGYVREYNLTQTSNTHWRCDTGTGADTTFEWRGTVVPFNRTTGMSGHITSVQGVQQAGHIVNDVMHAISLYDSSASHCAPIAVFRTIDNMNLKKTAGAATHAVSLSGTTIPDGIPINVEILSATTFRYYDDMGYHLVGNPSPIEPTGTVHTIPSPGTPYALGGRLSLPSSPAYINFPAGTYGIDERYSNVQTTHLTATTQLSSNGATVYEIAHVYDGTSTKLAVNSYTAGTADPSPVSAAQTGKVVSMAYETAAMGDNGNGIAFGGAPGPLGAALFVLGAQYSKSIEPAAGVPATYPKYDGANSKYYFIPYLGAGAIAQYGHDGLLKCWNNGPFCTRALVSPGPADGYLSNAHISKVTYDSGTGASGFITMSYCNRSSIHDWATAGIGNGLYVYQGFFNTIENFECSNAGYYGLAIVQAEFVSLNGGDRITGGMTYPVICHSSAFTLGTMFIDAQANPWSQIWGIAVQGFQCTELIISDESGSSVNGSGMAGGMVSVSAITGARLQFHGTCNGTSGRDRALVFAPAPNLEGTVVWDMATVSAGDREIDYLTPQYSTLTSPIIELGPQHARTTAAGQLSNRSELCLRAADMPVDDPIVLTDANATILRTAGSYFRLQPNTLTANRTLTLGDGAAHGQTMRISVRSQATYTYTILDGSTHQRLGIQRLDFNSFGSGTNGIIRSANGTYPVGSWLTEGFAVGDTVKIRGSVSNDGTYTVTAVTATILTFSVALVVESNQVYNVSIIGTPATLPTLVTVAAGTTYSNAFRRDTGWEIVG